MEWKWVWEGRDSTGRRARRNWCLWRKGDRNDEHDDGGDDEDEHDELNDYDDDEEE